MKAKAIVIPIEPHYRVKEVAKRLSLSRQKVTEMFEDLPGVKIIGERATTRKRQRYRTLLIPESVLLEHMARLE